MKKLSAVLALILAFSLLVATPGVKADGSSYFVGVI